MPRTDHETSTALLTSTQALTQKYHNGKLLQAASGLGRMINKPVGYIGNSRLAQNARKEDSRAASFADTTMADVIPFLFFAVKFSLNKLHKDTLYWPDMLYTATWALNLLITKQLLKQDQDAAAKRITWHMANTIPVAYFCLKYLSEHFFHEAGDIPTLALAGVWALYQVVPVFDRYHTAREARRTAVEGCIEEISKEATTREANAINQHYKDGETLATVAKAIGYALMLVGADRIDPNTALADQLKTCAIPLFGATLYALGFYQEQRNSKLRAKATNTTLGSTPHVGKYIFLTVAAFAASAAFAIIADGNKPAATQKKLQIGTAVSILIGTQLLCHLFKAFTNQADADLVTQASGTNRRNIDRSSHWYAAGSNVMHHSAVGQGVALLGIGLVMVNRHYHNDVAFLTPASALTFLVATIGAVQAYSESSKIYKRVITNGLTTAAADSEAGEALASASTAAPRNGMGNQEWHVSSLCCRR